MSSKGGWNIHFIAAKGTAIITGNPPAEVIDTLHGVPNLYYTDTDVTLTTNTENDD